MRARKAAAASAHFFSAKSFSALRTRSSREMECLFSLTSLLSADASAWAAGLAAGMRTGALATGSRRALSRRSSADFVFLAGAGSAEAGAAAKTAGAASAGRGEGAAESGTAAGRGGGGSVQRADEPAPAPTARLLPSVIGFCARSRSDSSLFARVAGADSGLAIAPAGALLGAADRNPPLAVAAAPTGAWARSSPAPPKGSLESSTNRRPAVPSLPGARAAEWGFSGSTACLDSA